VTEDEARDWLVQNHDVSRETMAALLHYMALVADEQQRQNLISLQTLTSFWTRHVVDSAQLIRYAKGQRPWLDIGSGAGLPGMVVAIITKAPVILVEPRPLRAEFLRHAAASLDLHNVHISATSLAQLPSKPMGVITARAVAALPKLLRMAGRFADLSTVWILPKGKSAREELALLPKACHGHWRIEQSVTDPESWILVGRGRQGE
jgi:16S rRNA (guanine527-N7)-methyltransferase